MIEGFRIDMKTDEIHAHIEKMIAYHNEQAALCEERLAKQRKRDAALREDDPSFSRNFIPARVDDPESQLRGHHERTVYLRFLRDHLIPNETFRLTEADLLALEVAAPFENPSSFLSGLAAFANAIGR